MHFPFPFSPPYKVQEDFMSALYSTIEDGKVGLFESPTGTGKSLSIICGAMKYLKDWQESAELHELDLKMENYFKTEKVNLKDPAWMVEQGRARVRKKFKDVIDASKEQKLAKADLLARLRKEDGNRKKIKLSAVQEVLVVDDYVISDCESDDGREAGIDVLEVDDFDQPKIIYATRTHSQIAQFVNEVKRTTYSESKCISLGSRKTLCVNESVQKMSSLARINDKCVDLTDKSLCSFKPKDSDDILSNFANMTLAVIRDIEEITELGRARRACPYYGVRKAVPDAEIVCVPYNLLLQKSAREASGISIKNAIVIIDEAHNVMDSITSIHSISLDQRRLDDCLIQLKNYYDRFKLRLSGKNTQFIKQIMHILARLQDAINETTTESLELLQQFVLRVKIDHLNLFKVVHFLEESRLANKLQGFTESKLKKVVEGIKEVSDNDFIAKHESPLRLVTALIKCLANPDSDGRVLISSNGIKYLLLNPANAFEGIVSDAKCVVLAGGTMSPTSDFVSQLFPYLEPNQLRYFSCGHVIPSNQLLPINLMSGPNGQEFIFNYANRANTAMVRDTGLAILQYCKTIKGGIVVFFPSYSYLAVMMESWKKGGIEKQLLAQKAVFMESNAHGGPSTDEMLANYSAAIKTPTQGRNGSLLFAVVGGKLSEGINFSDDLGRAVIMIGLPFPNKNSIELKEKMKYLDLKDGGLTGSEYYEIICMKAVNQCIGRAIRHQNDYATIILMDKRYKGASIRSKLPKWITDCRVRDFNRSNESILEVEAFLEACNRRL